MANTLREEGEIDERESFIDATFASAKGGGDGIGKTRRGKGVKILAMVERQGLPLSGSPHAAHPHEGTWVHLRFDFSRLEAKPEPLMGDRASDREGRDDDLKQDGVTLSAPHRSTRTLQTQDGRHLRRDQRRWLVERVVAWRQGTRRWRGRGDYDASNFLGVVHLASITMLLKQF